MPRVHIARGSQVSPRTSTMGSGHLPLHASRIASGVSCLDRREALAATGCQLLEARITPAADPYRLAVVPEHEVAIRVEQRPDGPALTQVDLDREQVMELVG